MRENQSKQHGRHRRGNFAARKFISSFSPKATTLSASFKSYKGLLYLTRIDAFPDFKDIGHFPLDQKFRFEIPGIPCDVWNSIFWLVGQYVPSFARKYEINKGETNMVDSLLLLLASELLDDSELEASDVLGEDNDITLFSVASCYMRWNLN